MKTFLFLYPIQPYFDEDGVGVHTAAMGRLLEIIDARYRQKGFQIVWLLFGSEMDPTYADMNLLDARVILGPSDQVLSCGVSFRMHCGEKLYPSCEYILNQLGTPRSLVLGGFHQSDCVDKVARTAHGMGIKVRVDEDTTNFMFCFSQFDTLPPVKRTRSAYARYFRGFLKRLVVPSFGQGVIHAYRSERASRPWLVPI